VRCVYVSVRGSKSTRRPDPTAQHNYAPHASPLVHAKHSPGCSPRTLEVQLNETHCAIGLLGLFFTVRSHPDAKVDLSGGRVRRACVLTLRPPSRSNPSDAPHRKPTVDVGCSFTEAARGGTQTFLPQRALHSTSCGRSNITVVVLLAVCVGMAWQPNPSCDAIRSGKPPSLPPVLSRIRARVSERAARCVTPVDTFSMPRARSTNSAAAYASNASRQKLVWR
jgi:hypothetical protein